MVISLTDLVKDRCQEIANYLDLYGSIELVGSSRINIYKIIINLLNGLYKIHREAFDLNLINKIKRSVNRKKLTTIFIYEEDENFVVEHWYLSGHKFYKVLSASPSLKIDQDGSVAFFSSDLKTGLWTKHIQSLAELKETIMLLEPLTAKSEIQSITEKYLIYLTQEQINKFQEELCVFYYQIQWNYSIYSEINEEDDALIKFWLPNSESTNIEYHKAKMLSARVAEKIAMKFYTSIEYKIRDISITQLTMESQDWKSYDILLDDKIAIDVKNSRNSVSNQTRYVEYCVPHFKENRHGEQVIIVGVMSPYLALKYLKKPSDINFSVGPIVYLGETTKHTIDKMSVKFTTKNLQIRIDNKHVLPPWIFEYPDRYYRRREYQINFLKSVIEKNDEKSKLLLDELSKKMLIPIILTAKIGLQDLAVLGLINKLKKWEIDFYEKIISQEKLTMPVLFLSILSHFIEMVRSEDVFYSPIEYKKFLFFEEDQDSMFPLGIVDPLNIINSFIETLETVWNYKDRGEKLDFEVFRFQGLGLLKGKKYNSDRFETIIAYCGGFIKGKGKCGNSPLIIGIHKVCKICGKLICNECNFCSENCQRGTSNNR